MQARSDVQYIISPVLYQLRHRSIKHREAAIDYSTSKGLLMDKNGDLMVTIDAAIENQSGMTAATIKNST